jgi:hypothetical protein
MRRVYLPLAILYTTLACVLTYPLVWHLSSAVPHDLGDPLLSTTLLWWNAHTTPLTARWWDGLWFWPAPGSVAFSDHRLGESLMATPLQWFGLNAVTAANLTLLAMFPLSALAAHWLAFTVTRRHDAAILCGLAYGFCPYRIAHLQHLELLGGFGMPAALAALHRYRDTSEWRWLVVFCAALILQGLCTSYYLLFFSILLVFWVFWFIGWRDTRRLAAIGLSCAVAMVALLPLLKGYERFHAWYGLQRSYSEILQLSADVSGLGVASPLIALWGWTAKWAHPEGELFPGLTIVAIVCVGAMLRWRRESPPRDRLDRWTIWLTAAATVCAALAFLGWTIAPWRIAYAGVSVSSDAPYKPFSLAVLGLAVVIGASPRMQGAYARQSPLAFYGLAAALLFLCALGPQPALFGHQVLYRPVYAWLMELPLFGVIRAPARFAMPAMLALSVAGALAFTRLTSDRTWRPAFTLLLMCGVVADSWVSNLPMMPLPDRWPAARADGFAAVLELPLGYVFDDIAAMYRSTDHHHPVLNGASGFEATHYFTLKSALEEHDPAALDGLPTGAPILVVVDRRKDTSGQLVQFLESGSRIRSLGADRHWQFFSAGPPPPRATVCGGDPLPIASAVDDKGPAPLDVLTDRNPHTWWTTVHAQQVGDTLTLELGRKARPCAVVVSVGEYRRNYPRKLVVEASETGVDWTVVATERTAGLTMRGALRDPRTIPIEIALTRSTARFVRLRIDESHPSVPWIVTDVEVRAEPAEE